MRNAVSFGITICGVGLIASACTFASPTRITMEASDVSADGGTSAPSSADPSSGGGAGGGGGACTSAFAKPDLTKLTACGGGKGHCYDKTKLAPTPAGQPEAYVPCPDASQMCIPDEILTAAGNPLKTCTSIAGKGGCVNMSILNVPDDERSSLSLLKQDVCDVGQNCVPCFDPRNNTNTPFCQPIGVYESACASSAAGGAAGGDAGPPAAPPEACCTTNGKSNGTCLPAAAIPAAQQSETVQDTCSGTGQCVPSSFLQGTTVKCDAGLLLGAGFCMDKCFNRIISIAGDVDLLTSDGCGATEFCIPCSFFSGQGVPGCS